MKYRHIPVMPQESVGYLNCRQGGVYVDCTMGGCGHARLILDEITPKGLLIGIDQDMDAVQNAEKLLGPFTKNVRIVHDNFINLPNILSQLDISAVDGILLDLGLSLNQIEQSGRGFSFRKDEPLDMRMDERCETTAAMIINKSDEAELIRIFRRYGEERRAKQIAKRILAERAKKPLKTSRELAEMILSTTPQAVRRKSRIHPATKVFMALRIAVNLELSRIEEFMCFAFDLLNPGGRLCVITFHSLEDRIVKQAIRAQAKACVCPPDFPQCVCGKKDLAKEITKKPLRPSDKEIEANPMARSAKLRVAERI